MRTYLAGIPLPALLAVAALAPPALCAQTIVGRVLDDARGSPVAGAVVRLLDRGDHERATAMADSAGRFTLAPPKAGDYVLEAVRLGYERTRSPLLQLHEGGSVPLDLMMTPQPVGLEGLEVTVEERAREMLGPLGLTPARLGTAWMSRAFIDSIQVKNDVGTVLQRRAIPGIYVSHPENQKYATVKTLCVRFERARTGSGADTCALLILNGVHIDSVMALDIDPASLEAIAVLQPMEATTFYGTPGGHGAVLMWTRQGRGR